MDAEERAEFNRIRKFAEGMSEVFLRQRNVVAVGVSTVTVKTGKSVFCIRFLVKSEDHDLPYEDGDMIDGIPVKIEIGNIEPCKEK